EWETPADTSLQVGYMMMDFDGRVLATVGGRQQKDGRLLWDNATQSVLQPGSTIKPVSSYVLALEDKKINYSSIISDTPTSDWGYVDGNLVSGPNNWYQQYYGNITVTRALNISSNAATVNVLKMVGLDRSYNFLTEKLNFKNLDPEQDRKNLAGLSIGGFYGGATVQEMTASYQMFCNGGYYYEPYTYYYVTDSDGNIILDNRDRGKPDQIISGETSTIMNRLLYDVVNSGGEALGYRAKISGWDIIGKTGTTDNSCDNWFVGASPYAVAGIWTGHKTSSPIAIDEQGKCGYLWRDIMEEWLKDKESKSFTLSDNVEQHNFYRTSGLLTNNTSGDNIGTGYYTSDNMPATYSKPVSHSSNSRDDENSDNSNNENSNTDENSDNSGDESVVSDDTSTDTTDTESTDTPSRQENPSSEVQGPSDEVGPGSVTSESGENTQQSTVENHNAA
ncbi:MAG: penicillin-binding transpeptidase domain-containing protein, partial [Acutalibacteraceae bacterium]